MVSDTNDWEEIKNDLLLLSKNCKDTMKKKYPEYISSKLREMLKQSMYLKIMIGKINDDEQYYHFSLLYEIVSLLYTSGVNMTLSNEERKNIHQIYYETKRIVKEGYLKMGVFFGVIY